MAEASSTNGAAAQAPPSELPTGEIPTGNACLVCWRSPTDRAHLIDRSLCPDPYHDPRRVVYLCREHHDAYDNHQLDLLPYLDRHRSELARAVECVGLITTLERVTGEQWAPLRRVMEAVTRDVGPEIVVNGKTVGHGAAGMRNALGEMLDA